MAIIARRIPSALGYISAHTVRSHTVRGGLGAMDRTAAASFCGQKYGITSSDFQPCVDWYAQGKSGDYAPASASSFLTNVLSAIMKPMAPSTGAAASSAVPTAAGGMSTNTKIALGLGAVGLLAIVMMTRK